MRHGSALLAGALGLVSLGTATLACGLGDEIVYGIGNSGNRFYATPVIDELAEELAANGVIAEVTDDMLRQAFDAIAARAQAGDAEAALILFRLAEAQRQAQRAEQE